MLVRALSLCLAAAVLTFTPAAASIAAPAVTGAMPAPVTRPSTLVPDSNHDDIAVHARSGAAAVAFRIDDGPYGTPVPVRSGVAVTTIPTDGYANGQHILSAVDCAADGRCGTNALTATVPLANAAPRITSPVPDAHLTGLVTVTAERPGGGGVRLLVDGVARGFGATAPYRFQISTSGLADGTHSVRTQLCSVDGTRCAGPLSPPIVVTSRALHPSLGRLRPAVISPDGNHVDDAASLTFSLPQAQTASVVVLDRAGGVVAGADLGTLQAGPHAWTWTGRGARGRRLPDGSYTLALETSLGRLRGWIATTGAVDTTAPAITERFAGSATFYPYPDGYRDSVDPIVLLGGTGTLTLTVTDHAGRVVRTLRAAGRVGRNVIPWNGTDARHHLVRAGTYRIRYTITDEAGNSRATPLGIVQVSLKRLRPETLTVTVGATRSDGLGASDTCARASTGGSRYRGGVLLVNACPVQDYDIAYAQYALTVPNALGYTALAIAVYGSSGATTARLTASIERTDGVLEVPGNVTAQLGRARWYTIATVPVAGHLNPSRRVYFTVALTRIAAGASRFDLGRVRLQVGVSVLR